MKAIIPQIDKVPPAKPCASATPQPSADIEAALHDLGLPHVRRGGPGLAGHLSRVLACTSLEELWALHKNKMADYGFDSLIYAYTYLLRDRDVGAIDDVLILSSFPPEYVESFIQNRYYLDAPMVRWTFAHTGSCSWGHLGKLLRSDQLEPRQRAALLLSEKHNLTVGYTISFPDLSARTKGAIALCCTSGRSQNDIDQVWAVHGHEIEVINTVTHQRIIAMPGIGVNRPLTPRQREVLEWVGDGKAAQDIATILAVTPATVEKHLRLAREALGVDTTAQAVLKATLQNQIYRVNTAQS